MKLRSMISTVSAYLDQYNDTLLTKKEDDSLLKVNTVILESLELLETNPSPKREEKMVSTLDKAFNKCIEVFANRGTPEILETQIEHATQSDTIKSKKSKGEFMAKNKKNTSAKKAKKNQADEIARQERVLKKLKAEAKKAKAKKKTVKSVEAKASKKSSKKNQPMGFRPEFDPQRVIDSIAEKVDLTPSKKKMLDRMVQDVARDLETATLPDPREFIKMMADVPSIIQNNKSSSQLLNLMTEEIENLRSEVKELRKMVRKHMKK